MPDRQWTTSSQADSEKLRRRLAITGYLLRRRRTNRMRSALMPAPAYSSAAFEMNSFRASFGSWYACPEMRTLRLRLTCWFCNPAQSSRRNLSTLPIAKSSS